MLCGTRSGQRQFQIQFVPGWCVCLAVLCVCLLSGQTTGKKGLKHHGAFPHLPIDDVDPSSIVLPRLNGVEVGHARSVRVPFLDGSSSVARSRVLQIKTLSLDPLIVEVPHFLTSLECKQLRDLAVSSGLNEHHLSLNSETAEEEDPNRTDEQPSREELDDKFLDLDLNGDRKVSVYELQDVFRKAQDCSIPAHDILHMLQLLNIDPDEDEFLSRDEFGLVKEKLVNEYVASYRQQVPSCRHRNRAEAMINDGYGGDIITHIKQRIAKVAEVPEQFAMKSESIQVARYMAGGTGHCIVDTDDPNKLEEDADGGPMKSMQCCNEYVQVGKQCRKCRFATMLLYLTDGIVGGETVFTAVGAPDINDNLTLQEEFYSMIGSARCNLSARCDGLKVKPEMGKAVFWYNHLPADYSMVNTNVGPVDHRTIHGDCTVESGQKWVASAWINYEPFHQDPPPGYGQDWGLEEEGEQPQPPTFRRMQFDDMIRGVPGAPEDGEDGDQDEMEVEDRHTEL